MVEYSEKSVCSTLTMKTVESFETYVNIYQSTRRNIAEDLNLQQHHYGDPISRNLFRTCFSPPLSPFRTFISFSSFLTYSIPFPPLFICPIAFLPLSFTDSVTQNTPLGGRRHLQRLP